MAPDEAAQAYPSKVARRGKVVNEAEGLRTD